MREAQDAPKCDGVIRPVRRGTPKSISPETVRVVAKILNDAIDAVGGIVRPGYVSVMAAGLEVAKRRGDKPSAATVRIWGRVRDAFLAETNPDGISIMDAAIVWLTLGDAIQNAMAIPAGEYFGHGGPTLTGRIGIAYPKDPNAPKEPVRDPNFG